MLSTIRAVVVSALAAAFLSRVAADFHYSVESCNEAQGGYFSSGFLLPVHLSTCADADNYYNPQTAIPPNTLHPNAMLCNHNVTVDLEALVWSSHDAGGKNPMHGTCTRLGSNGHGKNSTCNPPFAVCTFSDRVACKSSICTGK